VHDHLPQVQACPAAKDTLEQQIFVHFFDAITIDIQKVCLLLLRAEFLARAAQESNFRQNFGVDCDKRTPNADVLPEKSKASRLQLSTRAAK